ncbi:Methyl-accepting chemotaxis protein 4 [Caloramator mitchellensis]|uniref:Methyl-accepting chemotaxis protein 4 n=1 Tax=Caloramator mitchellensis TaxID=908809 RepID=A0A0R3JS40_CALMK|nr:cache domain-containing protein [Caloramator mitchellensis]KRQ86280.1 Methyl-accepting chemotaxis protein 4 [Caloramator mitchellensis]
MKKISIKVKMLSIFVAVVLLSMSVLGFMAYSVAKKSLTELGERALKNKVNMAIAFMEILEKNIQEGKLTREEAQEEFKSKMLNPKKDDGKTRGLNEKLELGISAYIFAINSQGVEMMHPFKEGDDISKAVDPKGNNIAKLIIDEGRNPKNNGIIHFYWQNPGENVVRAKTNAVGYFAPWDWYINVGAYDEDFYKAAKTVLNMIIIISLINLIVGSLFILWYLSKRLDPLNKLSLSMKEVKNGNLNISVDIKSNDEIAEIQRNFIDMVKTQKNIIEKIKITANDVLEKAEGLSAISEEMSSSSQEVAKTMQQVAEGSSSQANDLQDVAELMNKLTNSIENVYKELKNVNEETVNTAGKADTGKKEMDELIKSIDDIKNAFERVNIKINGLTNSVKEIGNITNVINSISEQTNLLALNAAIEAARAGEAGRGFAVVADEVRKLAEESKKSTDEINELINSIQNDTIEVTKTSDEVENFIIYQSTSVKNTVESFEEILNSIEKIVPKIAVVFEKMDEMNKAKEEVVVKVDSVSAITEENSAASEEVAASSEELSASSQEVAATSQSLTSTALDLSRTIDNFKL